MTRRRNISEVHASIAASPGQAVARMDRAGPADPGIAPGGV